MHINAMRTIIVHQRRSGITFFWYKLTFLPFAYSVCNQNNIHYIEPFISDSLFMSHFGNQSF